jgi:acyl-CoA thioesterase-1
MKLVFMHVVLRCAVFAFCACALACGGDSPRAPDSRPEVTEAPSPIREAPVSAPSTSGLPRIVFLGDSLTAGYGLARDQSVPALIEARLQREGYQYDVVNAGVSGDTSAGGVNRLDWSLQGPVRVLVVELGANDGLRGLPIAAMRDNLGQIIQRAKARGIKVVLTGMEAPPNYGHAYTSEFRDVFRALAAEHQVAFVPFLLQGVAGNPSLNIADGIHPNPEGARIVHETVWRAIHPLLTRAGGGAGEGR